MKNWPKPGDINHLLIHVNIIQINITVDVSFIVSWLISVIGIEFYEVTQESVTPSYIFSCPGWRKNSCIQESSDDKVI